MRLALLILAAFVSLTGCATPKRITEQQEQAAANAAKSGLASLSTPIPENLLRKQAGPLVVEQQEAYPADKARRSWNEDRRRLRVCVANHGSLVHELEVRDLISKPEGGR